MQAQWRDAEAGVKRKVRACAGGGRSTQFVPFMSAPAVETIYSKDNPFPGKISENRLLNKPGSAKETRHFIVDIAGSGLTYKVGDSLGVFPGNRPTEVAELIERLGATGDELVSPAMLKLAEPITLRAALSSRLA